MCETCGCSDQAKMKLSDVDHEHTHDDGTTHSHPHSHTHSHSHDHSHADDHSHSHEHSHADDHSHSHGSLRKSDKPRNAVVVETDILAKNNALAESNRDLFKRSGILALNLVSSPGSGKTTLLEKTILALNGQIKMSVLEGDQETSNDARRIRATGCSVVQINTGTGCHLEADIVASGLRHLEPSNDSVVFIENVGNLVCPALFDLGEHCKVLILSVTEGEDKPLKYPHMFRAAKLMILNKTDLLPYLNFDVELCIKNAREVNPEIQILQVSATTGAGMQGWFEWIKGTVTHPRPGIYGGPELESHDPV